MGGLDATAQDEVMPGRDLPPVSGSLNFGQCVKVSLKESPLLTSSSLEIDLRRLDESDAAYAFVPSFSLRTSYYLNQPQNNEDRPYAIQFVTETYNPIENYFNLRARQVLTRMGILAHMQVISDFLLRLGIGFLELDALNRVLDVQNDAMRLSEDGLAYARVRLESGGGTILDVRVAEQELEMVRLEMNKLETARATIVEGLRSMMGLKAEDGVRFDLQNVREQVLGSFDPHGFTMEDARKVSFELQIQALKRELQEKNITLAYARFLPTFIWGVQTTDPFSAREEKGLFFSVGFELPLWDGLKRYHNISRQKTILRQVVKEGTSKGGDFDQRWNAAHRQLGETAAGIKVARSQQDLVELRERQTAIGYHAGRLPLNVLLADRKALLDSRRKLLDQVLEHDKAVLEIRNLSGDLISNYVDTTVH
jgi:outer membrane protein TolC